MPARQFEINSFTFSPPKGFEEPFWNPRAKSTEKHYYADGNSGPAMLAVALIAFSLDSPLAGTEEAAANETCASASLAGWRKSRIITSVGAVETLMVGTVPAAKVHYKGTRDGAPRQGVVACIARGNEGMMIAFEEPDDEFGYMASVLAAIQRTTVATPSNTMEPTL